MQINVNGTLMQKEVLFSEADIRKRIKELAALINADYGVENTLVVLVILHGALIFAADLIRNFNMPTEIETLRLKSYQGTQSTGNIQLVTDLPHDLAGKHVLIVEDIVDTGRSLQFLLQKLTGAGVASLKVCTLLDKPEAHELSVKADYIGFEIGKQFVVGYGLDLDGKYRHLPYIANLVKQSA